MTLSPGTRLGPYEVVAPLGAGGMGEVYRAKDTRLQREVAIKLLPASLAHDAEALRRLGLEARAVAALNHPNLLTVHDVGTTESGSPYLVCELLEGETLRQTLAAGKFAPRKAVEVAVQMAHGLAAAHAKGIVHRDLKPDNIFCTADGRVKILDFGLAKLVEQVASDEQTVVTPGAAPATMKGTVLGTAGYMAPEQARGLAADARSDIFSFGAVLYEMLSGRRAFTGDTALDVITAILREEPAELATSSGTNSVAAVSPALDRIVRHCLEKQPQLRFQSAGDLAFSLSDLSHGSGSGLASTPSAADWPVSAKPGYSPSFGRRLGYSAFGFSGLVLAVVATWIVAARGGGEQPQFQRLTYETGIVSAARFTPDGQGAIGIARWNEAPTPALFTSRLDAQGEQPIAASATRLLAVAHGEAAVLQHVIGITGYSYFGTLALMPLNGGAPRPTLDFVQCAAYSPTGDLALTRWHEDSNTFTLEYPIGKVLVQTNGWIGDPRFSRDGKRIAFVDHPLLGDDGGRVAVITLKGLKTELGPSYESIRGLAWSPDGAEIWFTAANTIDHSLWAVSLAGKLRPLLSTATNLDLEDVLSDGRALLVASDPRQFLKLVTPEQPLPREFSVLDWPETAAISDDGKQVLVGDEDSGPLYSTYLRNADGSPPIRLGDGDPVGLSPDGQWAVSLPPTSPSQLWLLPTGAGQPHQLTHGAISFTNLPVAWLPGGQALLAIGAELGHPERTYRISLDGRAQPVTPEGVVGDVATPDGLAVLAMDIAHPGIRRVYPLDGGSPRALPGLDPGDLPLRYSADGKTLFVRRIPPRGPATAMPVIDLSTELWSIAIPAGSRRLLATVHPDGVDGTAGLSSVLAISGDGKTYAYLYSTNSGSLYLVRGLH